MANPGAVRVLLALVETFWKEGDPNGEVRIENLFADTEGRLRIVYRHVDVAFPMGLRVEIYEERDDEINRIISGELGEPPGALIGNMEIDENGVGWRDQSPLEWWYD